MNPESLPPFQALAFDLLHLDTLDEQHNGWAIPTPTSVRSLGMTREPSCRYFDFTVLSGDGAVRRRHGWYDPSTKLTVQTGQENPNEQNQARDD